MKEIEIYDSIESFNNKFGLKTLHPLIHIADMGLNEIPIIIDGAHSFNHYTIFLNDVKNRDIKYGQSYYDFQAGTMVFIAPMQVLKIENHSLEKTKGIVLKFHQDLLRGTQLGKKIYKYNFFSYDANEALHLSDDERGIVMNCFNNIEKELKQPWDTHSKDLIINNLELLLNYCYRFYERQFTTHSRIETDTLSRFENILGEYFNSDMAKENGIPTVKYCAEKMNFSINYLSDILRKETGKSALDHIQTWLIGIAKDKLKENKSVSEVAHELGFEYPQYFSRLFKKRVGISPFEYRNSK